MESSGGQRIWEELLLFIVVVVLRSKEIIGKGEQDD